MTENSTNPELREQYKLMLAGHDWWYTMSDDPTAYRRGAAYLAQLNHLQAELDPTAELWNQHAPADFRRKGVGA